jgi:hypothetical protein
MKVIAKIDNSRFICEVTKEEIAFLNGFRSSYDSGFDPKMTEVGAECNLGKMVSTSRFVRTLRPETLKKSKDTLEQAVKQIDSAMEIVAGLEIFNTLSEETQIGD